MVRHRCLQRILTLHSQWRRFAAGFFVYTMFFVGGMGANVTGGDSAPPIPNPSVFPPGRIDEQVAPNSHVVGDNFASSLPLLVVEYSGGDFTGTGTPAEISVYDSPSGVNSLSNSPTFTLPVIIEEDMVSASTPGKFSALLFLAGDQEIAPVSLAGLPASTEWYLHGSVRDKGMLRTSVALELGRVLMPDVTPQSRHCEVLSLLNGVYHYEGIHILGQNPLRNVNDLALSTPGEGPVVFLRQLVGRERRGQHVVRVGTRAFSIVPLDPRTLLSTDGRRRLGVELEKLDSILNSLEPTSFLTYQVQLDEQSLANFVLLNLLTLNAFDTRAPFFLMRGADGKFGFVPDWKFDNSLDNGLTRTRPLPFEEPFQLPPVTYLLERRVPVWRTLQTGGDFEDLRIYPVYQALSGDNFMWLDRLLLSRSFVEGLSARFNQLYHEELSHDNLRHMIFDLVASLGGALERDWLRWQDEYAAAEGPFALKPYVGKRITRNRQTWSYDQDVVKIVECLTNQSEFVHKRLEDLIWLSPDLYARGKSGTRESIFAFLSLVVMLVFTHLLTRK
ncbi:MAG: CotH kinase family protein [Planctomycetaceae bacterium]|nr:CotH kinase family protein [Planctomycetaceae bacterium]